MNENLKPVLIAGAGPTGLMAALSCWIQHSCPPDREKGRTRDHFTSNRGPGKNAVRRQNKLDGLNERDGVSSLGLSSGDGLVMQSAA